MKKFLINCMMFGVPVVAVVIVCYLFAPVNPNNYLAEINHKLHLLDSVEGRRMIFVGGSNVAFGVDSHAIADSLGMKVINTGLHAGLGLKYQLESVVGNLKEGDVLVIMPEYEQFYDCFWGVGETLGAAIKYSGFRGASNLSIKQWMGVLSAMPSVAYSDYKIKNRVDYRYTSLNFNSLGDEVAHRGKQRCDKVTINPIAGEIDEDAVDFVAGVLRDVKAGGHRVIMLPPAVIESKYLMNEEKIAELCRVLSERDTPFEVPPVAHMFPDSCAFDTEYHLSYSGVRLLTPILVSELRGLRDDR